jgi:hypothetical protein
MFRSQSSSDSTRRQIEMQASEPRLMDQAIATLQAAIKAGGGGSIWLPGLYVYRSRIDLAMGQSAQAEADANLALAALHTDQPTGRVSRKVGLAYLAKARDLASEGKTAQARTAASQALAQLQGSIGPEHPDTKSAQQLGQ